MKSKTKLMLIASSLITITQQANAFDIKKGYFLAQAGIFKSHQGQAQDIAIQGLIGDHFTITSHGQAQGLVGLAYLINGPQKDNLSIDYGINAFYLPKTSVKGDIIQEQMFTNLAYQYDIRHIPVYLNAKATIKKPQSNASLTLDAGIGPDFMKVSNYNDWSIDGGMTLPDRAFSGINKTTFSATAGVAIKLDKVLGSHAISCGYRFFYFGKASLNKRTDQIINTLSTGNITANALVCSAVI